MNGKGNDNSQRLGKPRFYGWRLAVFAFVAVRALPNITYPIGRDQATFCVIGDSLLRGQQLYRDLWDNKPPGIFYLYAGVVKLLGHVMWSVGVVDIFWLFAISCCIFRFTERHVGTAAAVIAVAVNASWHCRAGYVNAAQPETFIILLVFTVYFIIASEGRWMTARQFVSGFLFAAAFWIKYHAIAFLPFLLFVPYVDWRCLDVKPFRLGLLIPWRRWLWRVAVLLAGFLVLSVAVLAGFRLAGTWASLREIQFEVLPRYVGMAFQRTPDYWTVLIVSTIRGLGFWTIVAADVALLIAWKKREFSRLMPVFLGAVMGYISVAMQLRFPFYGFETSYPFLAIIWGYLTIKILESAKTIAQGFASRRQRLAEALVWALLIAGVFPPLFGEVSNLGQRYEQMGTWWRNPDQFYANYPRQFYLEHLGSQLDVIHYLKEQSSPADAVYVWGAHPLIYFLPGFQPPTRFISNFPLISPWGPLGWRAELLSKLEKSPPLFIVIARNDSIFPVTFTELDSEQSLKLFPQLNAFISEFYQPVAHFANFEIYRRDRIPDGG